MHRDREEEMSVPMFGQTFTLAQMDAAIREVASWNENPHQSKMDLEEVAQTICFISGMPMIDVLAGLQRLEEWRESQKDHPL
jgi:hypothetical protein